MATFSRNFIGPIRPQDRRASSSFIGPTLGPSGRTNSGGQILGVGTSQGGGGQPQPQQQQQSQGSPPLEDEGQPNLPDFDALIAPALEALDASVAPLEQQSAARVGELEAQRTGDVARTQQAIGAQERTLGTARKVQQESGESAVDEQRRQFSEIQQGLQARFGGTTGTGAFASEQAATQTLRNIGQVRQSLSQAMLQIDDKLQQVQEIGRITQADIEERTRAAISTERANLQQALSNIRLQRGELQSRKAELAANAMQIAQQRIAEVRARNTAFKQQLFVQQQQAEQTLKEQLAKAQSTAESFNPQNLVSQIRQLQTGLGPGFGVGANVGTSGKTSFNVAPVKPKDPKSSEEDDDLSILFPEEGGR